MTREDWYRFAGTDELLFADGFDECIIGVTKLITGVTVVNYDTEAVLGKLVSEGMTDEDALEHFEFNIVGAYVGEATPLFTSCTWLEQRVGMRKLREVQA